MTDVLLSRLQTHPLIQSANQQGFYAVLEGTPPWSLTTTLTNQARLYVNGIKATIGNEFVIDGTTINWIGDYPIDNDVVEVYG